MSDLTTKEIEKIVEAIEQSPKKGKKQIPIRPSIKRMGKLSFSPLQGETPRPLDELTEKEVGQLGDIKLSLDVVYGKTKLPLKEVAALQEGHMIKLNELCDELVEIYVNGTRIGRGEVVACDGQYGVKIVTLD